MLALLNKLLVKGVSQGTYIKSYISIARGLRGISQGRLAVYVDEQKLLILLNY